MATADQTPAPQGDYLDQLVRDYRQGSSLAHLAASTGWSASKIRLDLLAAGVTLRPSSPVPKDRQWWFDQFAGGATVSTLARQLQVTERTVLAHLRRQDLQIRPSPAPAAMTFDDWLALHVTTEQGCLRWTGPHTSHGYPITRRNGRYVIVRRIIWQHHHGPLTAGIEVLRAAGCRFLDCVALEHLYLAGAARRVAELVDEAAFVHGQDHWKTHLTTEQAQFIRHSTLTVAELAHRFDISVSSVQGIQARRRWRHLDQPTSANPTRPRIPRAQTPPGPDLGHT